MHPFSLSFVFLVLPLSVVVCFLLPVRARAYFLLVVSLLLYWSVAGNSVWLLAGVAVFDFVIVRLMLRCGEFVRLRRAILLTILLKSGALVVFYSAAAKHLGGGFPLGLGIVCLTGAAYALDCYRSRTAGARRPVDFLLLALFFPRLYAGPLVAGPRMLPQMSAMRMSLQKTGVGAELLIRGLFKKVVLGDSIYLLYQQLRRTALYDTTVPGLWFMVALLALASYYLFSGYCDIAKGVGLLFGFELPDNFRHPYRATSVGSFLLRFNSTANQYVRRYVGEYLGDMNAAVGGALGLLLAGMLTGLWFGLRVNCLLWGVYITLFVLFERSIRKYFDKVPALLRWIYSMAVVFCSFIIFAGDTPAQSYAYFKRMFGMGPAGTDNSLVIYLLTSNYLLLLIAVVGAFGLPERVSSFVRRYLPRFWAVLSAVLYAVLLAVCAAFMI